MIAMILRFLRVVVAQLISAFILQFGNVTIPYLNITIGALINAIFKLLRDKFPNSKILEWLPL